MEQVKFVPEPSAGYRVSPGQHFRQIVAVAMQDMHGLEQFLTVLSAGSINWLYAGYFAQFIPKG